MAEYVKKSDIKKAFLKGFIDREKYPEFVNWLAKEAERIVSDMPSADVQPLSTVAELKEAKRLLKAAVEDIHELLCDRKNLDGIGQSCNLCSHIDNCNCCTRCDIIPELRTWRYANEALKLIGER